MRLVRRELSEALLWYFGVLHDPPKRGRGGLGAYRWPCEEYGGGSSWKVKGLGEVELLRCAEESPAATAVQQMFICQEHTPYNNT